MPRSSRRPGFVAGAEALEVRGLGMFGTSRSWMRTSGSDRLVGLRGDDRVVVQWIFVKGPVLCCSLSSAGDLISRPEDGWSPSPTPSCGPCTRPSSREPTLLRGVAIRDPEATFVPAPAEPGPATALPNAVLVVLDRHRLRQPWRARCGAATRRADRTWLHAVNDPALGNAVSWLLQDPAGWWDGGDGDQRHHDRRATSAVPLRFLGADHGDIAEGAQRHILGKQRADGSSPHFDGPGDLIVEAYAALRLLGLDPSATTPWRGPAASSSTRGLAQAWVSPSCGWRCSASTPGTGC